jgi:hypothetical protein
VVLISKDRILTTLAPKPDAPGRRSRAYYCRSQRRLFEPGSNARPDDLAASSCYTDAALRGHLRDSTGARSSAAPLSALWQKKSSNVFVPASFISHS